MSDQQEDLERELKQTKRLLNQKEDEVDDLMAKLNDKRKGSENPSASPHDRDIIIKYENQIESYVDQIEALQRDIIFLRENTNNNQDPQSMHPNERKKLHDKIFAQNEQIKNLNNELQNLSDDNLNLERMLNDKGMNPNFDNDVRELRDRIAADDIQIKHLNRENFNLLSDIKIYKKRLEEFNQLKDMGDDSSDKDKIIRALEDEAIENEQLLQRFEQELDKKDNKILSQNTTIQSQNEEIDQLKYKLNEYLKRNSKNGLNKDKIELLIQENEKLRGIIQMGASKLGGSSFSNGNESSLGIERLEKEVEDLRALVERLKKEVRELKDKLAEAVKKAAFWEKKRDEIASKLHDLEALYEHVVEENQKKLMTISMMSIKIYLLMSGIKHLQGKKRK